MYFCKAKYFLFLALIISTLLASSVSSKRYSSKSIRSRNAPQDPIISAAEKFVDSYRKCLLDRLSKASKIWERIQPAIDSCLDKKFLRALDLHRMNMPDEHHHFYVILPISISTDSSCVTVRLDINNAEKLLGLKPEKTLRNLLPHCKFYGAGLVEEMHFRPLGKFYKKATSVIEPPTQVLDAGNGNFYNLTKLPLYPFMAKTKSLLEKIIKEPRIDYLWIHPGITFSLESGYIVPSSALKQYSILIDPINVTVCQVMIWSTPSLHESDGVDRMASVQPLFKNRYLSILSKSQFLPLKGEYSKSPDFLGEFYVNLHNPYCVKKFLAPAFCEGEECPVEDDDEDYDENFVVDHE